jgi:hypothetical protein
MSQQSSFPQKPSTVLTRNELVDYLLQHHSRGYAVFQVEGANGSFELVLNDIYCIRFTCVDEMVRVQGCTFNHAGWTLEVSSLADLWKSVDYIANQMIGASWQASPSCARVHNNTPASNLATISSLINTSAIEAIFDPYLENRSLTTLIDILSFGEGSVSNNVRVLSTSKTTNGQVPRLTKAGFESWLDQLSIAGQLRLMEPSEHRRFLILSSGQSLLLGPSLNSINKNEAVRLEPASQDQLFFDQVWSRAMPLT